MSAAQPRRREIWSVGGQLPRKVIAITANIFNELPDHPFVLAMDVQPGEALDGLSRSGSREGNSSSKLIASAKSRSTYSMIAFVNQWMCR